MLGERGTEDNRRRNRNGRLIICSRKAIPADQSPLLLPPMSCLFFSHRPCNSLFSSPVTGVAPTNNQVCHLITWIPCAKKPAVKEEIIIVPGVIDPAHQEEVFSLKKVRRLLPSLHHSDSDCLSKQLSKQAERGKIDATHEIFKEPRNRRELEKRQGPSARANRDRKPSSRDGTLNSDF
ncbi:uncharacterized protein ACIGJ3_011163 isoform 1-T1 [Trichechus inunguis]